MGRFGFRAGVNAENPDFTIIETNRGDRVRRLSVAADGSVTEDEVIVPLPTQEDS